MVEWMLLKIEFSTKLATKGEGGRGKGPPFTNLNSHLKSSTQNSIKSPFMLTFKTLGNVKTGT